MMILQIYECRKSLSARKFLLGSASAVSIITASHGAAAQQAPAAEPAQEVVVVAQAIRVSPSTTPVDVVQPTSVIEKEFIQNNIIPLASFDDIVKFAPSVYDQSPNGPGLGKSETLSIRGFQDGQYNVTFDGIPFGDATDLHHTSSALFIAHDLAEAEVDRGPGGGATIGNATFGGTMAFRTKDPLNTLTVNPYGTYGSFDTQAAGIEFDTGDTPVGKGFIDYQHETSDGYLTNASERRTNFELKHVWDINDALTPSWAATTTPLNIRLRAPRWPTSRRSDRTTALGPIRRHRTIIGTNRPITTRTSTTSILRPSSAAV
jgi:iron complex outermembrane receptor protein